MPSCIEILVDKNPNLNEFIWVCARTFIPIDLTDSKNPPHQKLDTYHKTRLDQEELELQQLQGMSRAESLLWGRKEKERKINLYKDYIKKEKERSHNAAYKNMLEKVKGWNLPNPDYASLKKYMMEHLENAIKYNNYTSYYEDELSKIENKTEEEIFKDTIKELHWGIDYHKKYWEEEVKQNEYRNNWLKTLAEHIGPQQIHNNMFKDREVRIGATIFQIWKGRYQNYNSESIRWARVEWGCNKNITATSWFRKEYGEKEFKWTKPSLDILFHGRSIAEYKILQEGLKLIIEEAEKLQQEIDFEQLRKVSNNG